LWGEWKRKELGGRLRLNGGRKAHDLKQKKKCCKGQYHALREVQGEEELEKVSEI